MTYRFGDFTLDDACRLLVLGNEEVHLSPKAFDLLAFLLDHRSRAVSKAELQQHLWPTTFVEETNIAGLVAEIRRALRDPAHEPLFIRTVYAFGYRFVGEVTVGPKVAPDEPGRTRFYLLSGGAEMLVMEGTSVIGRAEDATIRIDSPGVSRHHARILLSRGVATLEDARSKNGTHVNGERVSRAVPLADGDEIRLGTVVLRVRLATPGSPTATVPSGTGDLT